MALILYGGSAAEVLIKVDGAGRVIPAASENLNAILYTSEAGGINAQPLNSAGDPIVVTTDALGGIPTFYLDDEIVPDPPWVQRGEGLPRLRLDPATGGLTREVADNLYVLLEDVAQPSGVASLGGDGNVPMGQLPTTAVPVAGGLPRYNGDAQLTTQDPTTDLAAANKRWTEDTIHALAGIQDAAVLAADYENATDVLSTITGLEVAAVAGDVYFISAVLLYKAAGSTDIEVRVDVPSGSVVVGHAMGYSISATGATPNPSTESQRQRICNGVTGVTNQLSVPFGGIGTGTVHVPIYIEARIEVGANGDIKLQAAQNTGPDGANPVTIFAGSYCLFAHVAEVTP